MKKPICILALMLLLVWLTPTKPIDPWNLLSPKKIAIMITALTLIQIMGSAMAQFLGARAGAILTGFFGGLISSTATTASLARRSKIPNDVQRETGILTFLSATAAMLFEAAGLVLTGTDEIHYTLSLIFLGPLLTSGLMLLFYSRNIPHRESRLESSDFKIASILKLSAFIIAILTLSKILQNAFGQYGLIGLTFIVSLFEIHGSVIANVQLHDLGTISVPLLGGLLALSIIASYLSKLFLISTLGSSALKRQAIKATSLLFLSLLISWSLFIGLV